MTYPAAIPASNYALWNTEKNAWYFFRVRNGRKNTKWEHFQFIDMLVGSVGQFDTFPMRGAQRNTILAALMRDPAGCAKNFADKFTVCAKCGSPLTDAASLARGLGPTCAQSF